MIDSVSHPAATETVETIMRQELAHGDALLGTIPPILRHLLTNDDHSVFSDEIIARVRAVMSHIAGQLLDQTVRAGGERERVAHPQDEVEMLIATFVAHPGFLRHVHALALEWRLTERLQAHLGLDPVLSPLLQALVASSDQATSGAAMALLASQARFAQSQRRMEHPIGELPADLLHIALLALRGLPSFEGESQALALTAEQEIRARYDESRGRLGLASRLIVGMGGGASAALSVTHAGTALFLTALGFASGQERDVAVLSTNEGQLARLALALRAAGLKPQMVEEQFLSLHPEVALPEGFEQLGPDRAAALLAQSGAYGGG